MCATRLSSIDAILYHGIITNNFHNCWHICSHGRHQECCLARQYSTVVEEFAIQQLHPSLDVCVSIHLLQYGCYIGCDALVDHNGSKILEPRPFLSMHGAPVAFLVSSFERMQQQ